FALGDALLEIEEGALRAVPEVSKGGRGGLEVVHRGLELPESQACQSAQRQRARVLVLVAQTREAARGPRGESQRVTPRCEAEVEVGRVEIDVAGARRLAALRVRGARALEALQGLGEATAPRLEHGEAVIAVGNLRTAADLLPRAARAQEGR